MKLIFALICFISINYAFASGIKTSALEVTGATTLSGETASRAVYLDASKNIKASSTVDSTELGYLDGVTSSIQTQLAGKESTITTLGVSKGGTGAGSFTANYVLLGNGTSAFQTVAPGASGNMLVSNGTTWASSAVSGSTIVTAPGTTGPKECTIKDGGASESTVCSGSPCTEYLDTCSSASACTRSGSGLYSCSWAAGTWKNSTYINCYGSGSSSITGAAVSTHISGSDGSFTVLPRTFGGSATATDAHFSITCTGNGP